MISWPVIVDPDKKTISQVAMELGMWSYAMRIREVGGNNRGEWPDLYARSVGLEPIKAYPWCTSAWYAIYAEAARQKKVRNPFPRTARAVSVWDLIDPICRDSNPGVGAHYILDHGKDWASELGTGKRLTDNGHFGTCVELDGPNCKTELSANTNRDGSREGDSWWIHAGTPEVSHGGRLLGWIYVDRIQLKPLVA